MIDRPKKKAQAERWGRWAEHIAALIIRVKGYQILYRRLKTPVGEIDIVAKHRNILIIVEVKYRARLEDAKSSISHKQQQRLTRAGTYVLARQSRYDHIRFDVVAVAPWCLPSHIKAAWRTDA